MMRKSTLQLTILPSFRALGRKGGKPEVFEKNCVFSELLSLGDIEQAVL